MMNPLLQAMAKAAETDAIANKIQVGPTTNFAPQIPNIRPPAPNREMYQAPPMAAQPVAPEGEKKSGGILAFLKQNPEVLLSLASIGIGLGGGSNNAMAGAAGLTSGFTQGKQRQFENNQSEKKLGMEQERLDLDKKKLDISENQLSPNLQFRKDKRTEEILTKFEVNKVKKDMVSTAQQAAKRISSGIYGKVSRDWAKNLQPDDPAFADYQTIKMVLLDAQLANVAFTKGAISDAEMRLFGEAAANDELMSDPRMQIVFNKLNNFMNAEETAAINTYKKVYGEDPAEWEEIKALRGSAGPGQQGAGNGQSVGKYRLVQ